jgi:hypothetical protein
MAYSVSFPNLDDLFNEEKSNKKQKELETFLKCCKGNPAFVQGKVAVFIQDGGNLDPDVCEKIPTDVKQKVGNALVALLLKGQKVNGKQDNWCNGSFGSRWCDMDASKWNLDYVRCSFHSKASEENWPHPKPYAVVITCEKAKE